MVTSRVRAREDGLASLGASKRILILVPHEPEEDPRVKWVTQLCASIGRTDVIGFTWSTGEKPARQYDGHVYVERIHVSAYFLSGRFSHYLIYRGARGLVHLLGVVSRGLHSCMASDWARHVVSFGFQGRQSPVGSLPEPNEEDGEVLAQGQPSASQDHSAGGWPSAGIAGIKVMTTALRVVTATWRALGACITLPLREVAAAYKAVMTMAGVRLIAGSLYCRARASSVTPQLVICHDIYALLAAVRLKKLYGYPVIYDSHELWPEAYLEGGKWYRRLITAVEKKAVQYADIVITVSPQIARYLEQMYGISKAFSVPNAEPLRNSIAPSCDRPLALPVKFLFQGRIVPGRGIGELLNAWCRLDDDRAILVLRAPMNPYFERLRAEYRKAISEGRIVVAPAVGEDELVSAASLADVAIIPYKGPSLNHVYACPNKLSQCMHAGLAILCSSDMEFVSETVAHYNCGLSYDPSKPMSLAQVVRDLVKNTEHLQSMKRNAFKYAHSEFNWQVQSQQYLEAIEKLFRKGNRKDVGGA